jgi:hypothetical protein
VSKKEIRKLSNNKWINYLFIKYKYVENELGYKEYKKPRLWCVIFCWLVLIAVSPILTIIALISEIRDWFCYPMGQYGYEKYRVIKKENNNEEY